jgi:hypothetical protein
MIAFIIIACFYTKTQPQPIVEVVESEIEIIFVQGE